MISYTSADIHESLPLDPSYIRWFYTVPPPVVVPRTNDIYSPAHPQHRRGSPQRSPSSASERLSRRGGRYNDASDPDDNVDTPVRDQNGITIQRSSAETSHRTLQSLAQQPPSAIVERGHAGAPLPHTEEPHLPSRSPQSLPPGDPEFPFTEDETSGGMVGTPVPINWAVSLIAPDGKAESKGSLTSPSLTYLSSRRKEDLCFVAMRHTTPRPFEPRRIPVFQLIPPSRESHLGPHTAAKNTGIFPQIPALVQSPTDQTEPNNKIPSPPRRKLPKPPNSLNAHLNNRANVFNEDFDPPSEEMREALEVFPPCMVWTSLGSKPPLARHHSRPRRLLHRPQLRTDRSARNLFAWSPMNTNGSFTVLRGSSQETMRICLGRGALDSGGAGWRKSLPNRSRTRLRLSWRQQGSLRSSNVPLSTLTPAHRSAHV